MFSHLLQAGCTSPMDSTFVLDIEQSSISIEVDRYGFTESNQFIEIEIVEVKNPDNYPVTFEVHKKGANQAKPQLGTFSLYPNDNPGKFIVAVGENIGNGDQLIIKLVLPDGAKNKNDLTITGGTISFK